MEDFKKQDNYRMENSKKERYNNSKRVVYTPIIIILVLALGIFIGNRLIPDNNTVQTSLNLNRTDKISSILRLIQENYVDKVSIDSIEELAIPHILHNLDPHTAYFPPKINTEEHEKLSGNFDGIGVQFNIQNDTILIVNTISGGPSEKVGVLAGDRIITINDSLFAGVGVTNDDVMNNLKGKKGTKVTIGVKRSGIDKLIEFEIIRDKIPIYSIDVSYMVNKEIGYIKISRFAGTTYAEFMEASTKLKKEGMTKLILDLRENGGGYMDAAINIIDEFLPKGKMIVYTKGLYRNKVEYKATNNHFLKNIELVVMINSWSASASEIVSGAIQDNDRGIILGRRSFGKGLVQEQFSFPDNSGLRITTARYYTPSGRSIQKPYDNGIESYFHDIYNRMENGQLANADSINFPDSLKFKTESGKTVFGGGGIMPDVFVPIDTTGYTNYLQELISKGLIYKYALTYADKNRTVLSSLKGYEEIDKYLDSKNVIKGFVQFAQNENVHASGIEYSLSKKIIKTRLHAYIARNIMDNDGYFPIIKQIDTDLQKAVEILN